MTTGENHYWSEVVAIARREDHDRYNCALYAKGGDRQYLMALLAFNWEVARVREMVSEPMLGEIRLQWWSDVIDEICDGTIRAHPVAQALSDAINERDLPQELFFEIIDARTLDLEAAGPANLDALHAFASATGGALHELQMRIAGGTGDLLKAARAAGTAWALTGLLRAVGFHASMNKMYLPEDEMAALGLGPDDIYRGEFTDELRGVLKQIGTAARAQLQWARELSKSAKKRQMPALLPAALAANYLKHMEAKHYDMSKCDFDRGGFSRLLSVLLAYLFRRI